MSRYADVLQALAHPQLLPCGTDINAPALAQAVDAPGAVRQAIQKALAPATTARWRESLATHSRALFAALPENAPTCLLKTVAKPLGLELALQVTGVPHAAAAKCDDLAQSVYRAAAMAQNGRPSEESLATATALARQLMAVQTQPSAMADVQTFVALSQTLPALLAGAWRELIVQPQALSQLQADPSRVAAAAGELQRLGSPARAVFRQAASDIHIGHATVPRGSAMTLLLWEANRDPDKFPNPHQLNFACSRAGQLGLGSGTHPCAGAALVHMALTVSTTVLLEACAGLALADDGAAASGGWAEGFAMRTPSALQVRLRRAPTGQPHKQVS